MAIKSQTASRLFKKLTPKATNLSNAYSNSYADHTYQPSADGFQKLLDRGYDPNLMMEDADKFFAGNYLAHDLGDPNALDYLDNVSKLAADSPQEIADTFTGLNLSGDPNAPLKSKLKTMFYKMVKPGYGTAK